MKFYQTSLHACEHLWEAAIDFFGKENKTEYRNWAEPIEALLWDGKIDIVLNMIKETVADTRKDQTPLNQLLGYYEGNKEAMKYKEFRDKGYFIGSGLIESAIKYILTTRFKITGANWKAANAESLAWLRTKYFEDRWDTFWEKMNCRNFMKGQKLFEMIASP